MAEYQGEYGHPYPRVDQYGNPVPPVDEYGNPVPREPPLAAGLMGDTAPLYGGAAGDTRYAAATPGDVYGAAYPSGGVAPGEPALAYEGMVGGGGGIGAATATAGMLGGQLQPARAEEHTFGSSQLEPTGRKEEHTTLGEKLTRSGSSSSSSSSEDDGQGGRRKKKSIKEKIKEKLPGTHKQHEERKAGHAAPATTHAAGAHEKKGFIDKIKDKLPGHH